MNRINVTGEKKEKKNKFEFQESFNFSSLATGNRQNNGILETRYLSCLEIDIECYF